LGISFLPFSDKSLWVPGFSGTGPEIDTPGFDTYSRISMYVIKFENCDIRTSVEAIISSKSFNIGFTEIVGFYKHGCFQEELIKYYHQENEFINV
jgi:hypothetical protein